jgi:hypothetical protein
MQTAQEHVSRPASLAATSWSRQRKDDDRETALVNPHACALLARDGGKMLCALFIQHFKEKRSVSSLQI